TSSAKTAQPVGLCAACPRNKLWRKSSTPIELLSTSVQQICATKCSDMGNLADPLAAGAKPELSNPSRSRRFLPFPPPFILRTRLEIELPRHPRFAAAERLNPYNRSGFCSPLHGQQSNFQSGSVPPDPGSAGRCEKGLCPLFQVQGRRGDFDQP